MSSITEEVTDPLEDAHQHFDTLLILDAGSQYTHLICRRLRELHVLAEVFPCTTKSDALKFKPKGIILSGGPHSVYEENAPCFDPAFFDLSDTPILGICYGLQAIAFRLSKSNVIAGAEREYGQAVVIPERHDTHVDRLFEGLGDSFQAYMSHGDRLSQLPLNFCTIAKTEHSPFAGIAHETKPYYAVQFHPEVTHTPKGIVLLRNFAIGICGAKPNWSMSNFCQNEIGRIRKLVGPRAQVIGAVSGGVDSTVAAKLMKEAIGDRFHAVLVDNGLMRQSDYGITESTQVKQTLAEHLGISLTVVDASQRFLDALKNIINPEKKRQIIGHLFIEIFEEQATRIEKEAENTPYAGKVEWFLQGTLYPDVIESTSFKGPSSKIKSHHNVSLPQRMMDGLGLRLLEPLRELFKDEVRALGRELFLHEELVMRHPFPGPGIGVRVIGAIDAERVKIARQADYIFISNIKEAGIYNSISQAYAGLDTNKAVGVMGDKRYEGYIVILRAVVTTDFMTAEPYPFEFDFLTKVSRAIVNQVHGVSLVVYNTTSKPPGTIELQ